MGIGDVRFGAEVVTKKGKTFKFDDTHCLQGFLKQHEVSANEIKNIYLVNYSQPHQLVIANRAYLLGSDQFRTPMGGNIAAFDNNDSLRNIQQFTNGSIVNWNDLAKQ